MNRVAWVIAIGYAALALISAGMYAASTAKFVDYSETLLVFPPPRIENATFTPIPGGWNVSLHWRVDNPGRLPIHFAIFEFDVVVDNRSDPNPWDDGAKIAKEYEILGSLQSDRLRGPVIPPGGFIRVDWYVNETSPESGRKIAAARDPVNGGYYITVLGGQVVFYVANVNELLVGRLPRAWGRA